MGVFRNSQADDFESGRCGRVTSGVCEILGGRREV